MNEDNDEQKVSTEEATYHGTLEIIDYEISKNRKEIDEARTNPDIPFWQSLSTKRHIKDLEQRIIQLEQRRREVEEQEENGRDDC
jgi:hypothetical protein